MLNFCSSGIVTLTGLSNGLHNITVFAQDTFGNIGSSETISFTIANPESFAVGSVAAVSIVAVVLVVVAGLLVYNKRKGGLVKKA